MQKEDKVYKVQPADRVGSVQEYYFSKKLKEVAEMNAAKLFATMHNVQMRMVINPTLVFQNYDKPLLTGIRHGIT